MAHNGAYDVLNTSNQTSRDTVQKLVTKFGTLDFLVARLDRCPASLLNGEPFRIPLGLPMCPYDALG